MKKILFTGGGTAGHVTPNIALFDEAEKRGYELVYIGSKKGIEKGLIEDENVRFYSIFSGKLRRYFSVENFIDPFKVLIGCIQSIFILMKEKPNIVFSKGGFVSVPVVYAAKILGIPSIIHESDITPGLANKICIKVAKYVCCNFKDTFKYLPKEKAVLTGSPIRKELLEGRKEDGGKLMLFKDPEKPVLLIIGGSMGSNNVNNFIRNILSRLIEKFNIVHICGKGNIKEIEDEDIKSSYRQFEYIKEDLKDVFALSDIVVSRAGANSICEILALKKPNVLIPLSKKASRGDQIDNAKMFVREGYSLMIEEENITNDILFDLINKCFDEREIFISNMNNSNIGDAVVNIINLIEENVK